MSDDLTNIKQALKAAYPDLGKMTFRKRGSKYYVTVETNSLDPTEKFKDFKVSLRNEAAKSGWAVGVTSSGFTGDNLRTTTFRINYKRDF